MRKFYFTNLVPISDIGVPSSQITWPRTLKISDLIRFWRQSRQCYEQIQGSTDTKLLNVIIMWKNGADVLITGLCVLQNLDGKFVYSNTWC